MFKLENLSNKLIWKIPLMLILLISLGSLLMIFFLKNEPFTLNHFIYSSVNSVIVGGVFFIGFKMIINILDRKLLWLEHPFKRLLIQFFITIVFSLIVIVFAIYFNGFFTNQKVTWSYFVESGIFMMKIIFTFIFFSSLIVNTILFFKNWKEAAVQQEILKRQHVVLQYERLKSYVNPHFLFNNLNSLTSLISSNPNSAIDFVKQLSDVYRYVIDQNDQELVDLQTELRFLDSYIYLHKIRFGQNLRVQIEVESVDYYVIPLSIQMLVENAIKHNEISDKKPLVIRIFTIDHGYLTVENQLQKKSKSEGNGSGLTNIKARYEFFTDKKVTIGNSHDKFWVTVPLLTK